MDGCAAKNEPSWTLSGLEAAALGLAGEGAGLGAINRGAATVQTARASAASVTKAARSKNSDRLPQTGLIYSILLRKRFHNYPPFEGGLRF